MFYFVADWFLIVRVIHKVMERTTKVCISNSFTYYVWQQMLDI